MRGQIGSQVPREVHRHEGRPIISFGHVIKLLHAYDGHETGYFSLFKASQDESYNKYDKKYFYDILPTLALSFDVKRL